MSKKRYGGPVVPSHLYRLDELQERLGLGSHCLRLAQSRGLPTRRIGRRKFVLGCDVISYILDFGEATETAPEHEPRPARGRAVK